MKNDLSTIIIVVITLTLLAIFGLVFTKYTSEIGSELRDAGNDLNINQTYVNESTEFIVEDMPSYSDNYIFWFFLATFIGLILTALYLEFEPSIMIIILIFGSIAVLGAWMGSDIYTEFSQDDNLNVTSADMSKTQLLMSNPYFPVFILIGLLVMIIVMYNKKRSGEYQ